MDRELERSCQCAEQRLKSAGLAFVQRHVISSSSKSVPQLLNRSGDLRRVSHPARMRNLSRFLALDR